MGPLECFLDRRCIVVPFGQAVDIDPAELPLLERVFLAFQKPFQFGRLSDVQPDLEQADAVLDQQMFKVGDLTKPRFALFRCAKTEHFFDDAPVIP